jgi:hypothetical protein
VGKNREVTEDLVADIFTFNRQIVLPDHSCTHACVIA